MKVKTKSLAIVWIFYLNERNSKTERVNQEYLRIPTVSSQKSGWGEGGGEEKRKK